MIIKRRFNKYVGKSAVFALFCAVTLYSEGLSGEYLLTQRWRDMLAGHSSLHNPAFLTCEDYPTVRYSYTSVLENLFKLWEFGYTQPIGLKQSAGLSWFGENDGKIRTSSVDAGRNVTDGGKAGNQNNFFVLSYAVEPFKMLSIGTNINVAYQTLFGNSAAGLGADAGLALLIPSHRILGSHRLGVFFQNLVPVKLHNESERVYSTNLKFSWLIGLWEDRVETGIDLNLKDIKSPFGKSPQSSGEALESSQRETDLDLNYRIGLHSLNALKTCFQIGSDYWGMTGGLNVPKINKGRDLMVLYQYMSLTKGHTGTVHSFYVLLEAGKSREDIHAARMARLALIEPVNLYNKALKLYNEKKYWDAFLVFSELLSKYPEFHMNDMASYYRAGCFEKMDMRDQAVNMYEEIKEKYEQADVAVLSGLGIMRVKYRAGDYSGVARQYSLLKASPAGDSIKQHASYLMGEAHMKRGEYADAKKRFDLIEKRHPEYVFAQHSAAVACVNEGKMDEAVIRFYNCIHAEVSKKHQQEIVDRSLLFLGYIFYERNSLSSAVNAFHEVYETSIYYPYTLLGLGWSALKAKQWDDCINAGEKASRVSDKPGVVSEAALLESYGFIMKNNYIQAKRVLTEASEILDNIKYPVKDSIAKVRDICNSERQKYRELSYDILKASGNKKDQNAVKTMESDYRKIYEKISGCKSFINDQKFYNFFNYNIGKIREDVNYALAVVMKKTVNVEEVELMKELEEKQSTIDKQIEGLEEEINDIGQEEPAE